MNCIQFNIYQCVTVFYKHPTDNMVGRQKLDKIEVFRVGYEHIDTTICYQLRKISGLEDMKFY